MHILNLTKSLIDLLQCLAYFFLISYRFTLLINQLFTCQSITKRFRVFFLPRNIPEDNSQSEDEQLCKIDEEEDEDLSKIRPEEDGHLGKVQLDEDELLAKIQQEEDERRAKFQLEEDEQLARAIQESLNIGSPPRYGNDSLIQPSPHLFPPGYR